jgi:tRNA U34 2-thiouridine synthase MnmA/TrmU
VLAVLTSEQLARAMFPLGESTKDQARKEAAERTWPPPARGVVGGQVAVVYDNVVLGRATISATF